MLQQFGSFDLVVKYFRSKEYNQFTMAIYSYTLKILQGTSEYVLKELKELDLGNLTPIEALNTLYQLQNKLKNRW